MSHPNKITWEWLKRNYLDRALPTAAIIIHLYVVIIRDNSDTITDYHKFFELIKELSILIDYRKDNLKVTCCLLLEDQDGYISNDAYTIRSRSAIENNTTLIGYKQPFEFSHTVLARSERHSVSYKWLDYRHR